MVKDLWWHVKGLASLLCIGGLLAWVVLGGSPSHKKESYEKACKEMGGVVAYTIKVGEAVCVKK